MGKRWTYKITPAASAVEALSKSLNINSHLATILLQRDIADFEADKKFFRPSLDQLHDPFLMKDMREAVERLKKAIDQKEKILVYGDYDVDGTTSVSLVYSYLRNFYPHC